jgi:lysophospholipase L1-like esterase
MANKIIKAQMKQRRDTKANWAAQNPVLLAGELGIVSDDPNLYKVGDGTTAWNALPFRGFDGTLAQETGDSETAVMSQKAVTALIAEISAEINGSIYPSFEVKQGFGQLPQNMKPFAFKKGEFSIKCVTDATTTNYVNVYLYDEDKQQVGDIFIAYDYAKTYTIEQDVAYVGIYMPSTQIVKDGEVTIIIEAEGTDGIVGKIGELESKIGTKISGEIVGVGKNLYDKGIELDGYIDYNQTPGANPSYQSTLPSYGHSDLIPVCPGVSYHIKAEQPCGGFYKLFLDEDKKVASLTDAQGINFYNVDNDVTLVAPSNAAFLVITTRFGGTSCVDLQVEIGDKATIYENYKGAQSLPLESLPIHLQEATKAALETKPKVEKLESLLITEGEKKVYASAGDSLTQGTGAAVGAIDKADDFYPLSGTAQKTYAYMIAKRNNMAWRNYGISGSTMGNAIFNGQSNNPFCVNRYMNMADDIDVISLWFGVNDSYYGKYAKAEEWLQKTYGKKIYYPISASQQGTTAADGTPYATNEQYMACITAEEEFNGVKYKGFALYEKQYEGLPTDTDDTTWWGAWNKVLPYLIEKYPFAKILIIAGYGASDGLDEAAKAIAKKYGVQYLDLRDYGITWKEADEQPATINYDAADFADRTYFKEYASGMVSVNEFRKRTMLYDGTHFNKYGYEYITPFIERALHL